METIAGESPSLGQLAENLSDPGDADVAYKELWNVRARSWANDSRVLAHNYAHLARSDRFLRCKISRQNSATKNGNVVTVASTAEPVVAKQIWAT
jgi:hypothetical protein